LVGTPARFGHRRARVPPSRKRSTLATIRRAGNAAASPGEAAVSTATDSVAGVAPSGQSGQRRSLAQHGPSGLRAVAGAASATWQRRAAQRGSERRVDVKVALGQDAKSRPLRPQGRDARWNKRDGRTPLASRPRVCLVSLRAAWRCTSLRLIARRGPVFTNRGGRPAARGSRPPRAMIAPSRAGAPRRTRAIAQARRASEQARP